MTDSADERALRRELQVLAKKRAELDKSKSRRTGVAGKTTRGPISVFARLGGTPNRSGRHVVQLKENNTRGNPSWRLGKRSIQHSGQTNLVKKQKLHSAVARPEGSTHPEERLESSKSLATATSPSSDSARIQERKQRAVEPYIQKDGIARSRRMFGALMGHLGKAKRQIEKDTDLFKRQDTKQQEAEQREKEQSKNLEIQARQEAEIARVKALLARTELDRSEQVARAKLEHLQMIRKSESQSKFLVTIASPPINYLPAKHTKETKELVAASMEAHEAKIKASERSHEEKLRKLEAEFAVKVEKLSLELKGLQKNSDEEETTGEQVTSEKEDECDQGIDRVSKQLKENEHGLDELTKQSDRDVATEVENKDITMDVVSDTEMDGVIEQSRAGVEDACNAEVQGSDATEESASRQVNGNGTGGDHKDGEASSPHNEEKEDPQQTDQTSTAGINTAREVRARFADEPDIVESTSDDKSSPSVPPKEDGTAAIEKLKVADLRVELKKRGLDTKGLKASLVQRLRESMHAFNEST
ncbi:hypothetical protein PsorP6_013108 [Peronosclerospora sorghi]|uniref:Uncharacterized protein n=1 Tax=Peronosclerospora sorghi TaxID=230839 RepID=A0ACC0WG28_9STRA|nr:hypothetical protein PsorP6_013108 [Peronosclerospora sorghi]